MNSQNLISWYQPHPVGISLSNYVFVNATGCRSDMVRESILWGEDTSYILKVHGR